METAYKVFTQKEWEQFQNTGEFLGSENDIKDGFIHLSTKTQYEGVIKRYFKDIKPLYIVEVELKNCAESVKWEKSSSGEEFPHLYNTPLKSNWIVDVTTVS